MTENEVTALIILVSIGYIQIAITGIVKCGLSNVRRGRKFQRGIAIGAITWVIGSALLYGLWKGIALILGG